MAKTKPRKKKVTKKKTIKSGPRKRVARLSPQDKEQKLQISEITTTLRNIGFIKIPAIDGKEVVYKDRTTEMDDIFVLENIILVTEYTIGDPGTHLLKKKIFYDKVVENKRDFISFLRSEDKLISFRNYFEKEIKGKYSDNELQVKIIYCSKKAITDEHRSQVSSVVYFDYHVVKYFSELAKVIKKSSKFEFLDFLNISYNKFSKNIKASNTGSYHSFSGHILPEERSAFDEGYKIVTFYIDAESLLKRAYVLRQDGWRDAEGVGHYQRMFVSSKLSSMRKYLAKEGRVFINNIIASISSEKVKIKDSGGNELKLLSNGQFQGDDTSNVIPAQIEITDECNIIGIIDGQHRTYSYYEGDDIFETEISKQRTIQNLLVTGILFPANESRRKRLEFEAKLFLEINSNQSNAHAKLKQEIELLLNPTSAVSISKKVLNKLNSSGPLHDVLEQYWYEKNRIKTASIVNYGLKILVKVGGSNDSLFYLWSHADKGDLLKPEVSESLLKEYVDFCAEKIRDVLIAFKKILGNDIWKPQAPSSKDGILSVTFINGLLNVLRLLIENDKVSTVDQYVLRLGGVDQFKFKAYKSSQYRKMGEEIYKRFLK